MKYKELELLFNEYDNIASKEHIFDYALLKMWIQFENYITQLFLSYLNGEKSEEGYTPSPTIVFNGDGEEIITRIFGYNRSYVDYIEIIESLSKTLFHDNKFDIIISDSKYSNIYNDVIVLRNYIAHESGQAKAKYIKTFFGDEAKMVSPNDFLQNKLKNKKISRYEYYKNGLLDIAHYLIENASY